ncbi:MAG: hypothetical protein A2186_03570 [Candidatus Levybacteria bacterium RIFOXYA1_FULL_41_10]|nr:MAG: hypothetical protein UU45_C0010G0019 [Candidatus Levybacteria bacterium GW2011_GWA2_41_15]OGH50951.1 MAG: hypothetical protein A3J18_02235 [Candidatus Levybacteria bacterium RIFCSPLOWO2_02_FULL_40_18]OGH53633.1 MAG: hypothetical protein A3H20_00990 [Candidatus Levybacteria bacterium RIFCSPLOWO2_12_FULL_41_12]OGH54382.1 MAG: hypothetical protein A2596_01520 [Candidatus Levybacteria bacterium RIFOXYD1_FULL_40_21]OGH55753.1 MAG: hypothetical protein A2423_01230 [Candidatus Levybacteria bac
MTDGPFKPTPQSAAKDREKSPFSRYENYVLSAGKMVAEGRYQDAIRSLQDPEIPRRFGIGIREGRGLRLLSKPPSHEKLRGIRTRIALSSWFHIEQREIELGELSASPGVEVPEELWHDVALIYLHEWLHGLQLLTGGSLTDQADDEIDIGIYLINHGIPLTVNYIEMDGLEKFLDVKPE